MSIEELVASLNNEQLLALLSALKENETTIELYDAAEYLAYIRKLL